ncbi:MAG: hypothetical protein ACREYF_02120 [Gammaproteobacteria bacterium]
MISVVVYGRNDSYGYNLHKRAALSLNCMAEVLTEPMDEILFVDYNTPDDYPTFPEAIQDTLTERAKERLRIFRVRPAVHARFQRKSHLLTLEPVARNVAVRRSDPENRWILSSNTDMIFVLHKAMSLSSVVKDLPKGFYHLPRFEIPEALWETFDRKDVSGTIDAIRYWARKGHLNEIVLSAPVIRFYAPGDFQLIEREDIFRIHGFDESMLLGWHVDSNIAKRLYLLHGEIGDLLDHVYGYHCDHTRQVTPAHRLNSVSNDWCVFVDAVDRPERCSQADNWGCASDDIEEIRLSHTRSSVYFDALKTVIKEEMQEPATAAYVPDSFDKVTYSPAHVLPFLADIFVNAPPRTSLGWIGANSEMFELFMDLWSRMDFGGPILVYEKFQTALGTRVAMGRGAQKYAVVDLDAIAVKSDALIFDFCVNVPGSEAGDSNTDASNAILDAIGSAFLELVMRERARLAAEFPPRRFVCVNAINNRFESIVSEFVGVANTPFSSRIRLGFVYRPAPGIIDWTDRMSVGSAGVKVNSEIRTRRHESGNVMHGPHALLVPGRYRLSVHVNLNSPAFMRMFPKFLYPVVLKVIGGGKEFARKEVSAADLAGGVVAVEFEIKMSDFLRQDFMDLIMWTGGLYEFGVKRVEVKLVSSPGDLPII